MSLFTMMIMLYELYWFIDHSAGDTFYKGYSYNYKTMNAFIINMRLYS